MVRAVYPGSFDPITNGHLNIINRAAKLYDELIVLVAISPSKKPFFSIEEKLNMIKDSVKHLPNVKVDFYEGLVVDYASKNDVQVLVRGLRAVSDFEYEFQLAAANRFINKDIEMVFFMANSENNFISSSMIKEMALAGQDVSSLVPPMVTKYLEEKVK
ncbi:MAG: pantetheine-phosphate adenylyltransferase [Bacilli bacterium]